MTKQTTLFPSSFSSTFSSQKEKWKVSLNKASISISARLCDIDDVVFSPLSQLKCYQCGAFGKSVWCSDKVPPYFVFEKKVRSYEGVLIVLGRIDIRRCIAGMEQNYKLLFRVGVGADVKVKLATHERLNHLRDNLNLRANLWCDVGGICHLKCKRGCNVKRGLKCRYAGQVSFTPERIGIDVYATLKNVGEYIQIPPNYIYTCVGMIFVRKEERERVSEMIGVLSSSSSPEITESISERKCEINGVEDIINPLDVFAPDEAKRVCEECKFPHFYCRNDRIEYSTLKGWLKDKVLLVIDLSHHTKRKQMIDTLYSYVLALHRCGYYDVLGLLNGGCRMCERCSLEHHMATGYKTVQNRRIPFCPHLLGLMVNDEKKGYLLVKKDIVGDVK